MMSEYRRKAEDIHTGVSLYEKPTSKQSTKGSIYMDNLTWRVSAWAGIHLHSRAEPDHCNDEAQAGWASRLIPPGKELVWVSDHEHSEESIHTAQPSIIAWGGRIACYGVLSPQKVKASSWCGTLQVARYSGWVRYQLRQGVVLEMGDWLHTAGLLKY